ncbi:MAG: DNA recombination protein RmuC [Candidatus Komeilibacteria bacterium CG10_big_fil_rev_8_21_14_0_10_41_13]|uniref:DNA recombination protein RmuC n=1 Tax=Candidatus Komeilibacteria bacterium CG10_big_fil_rev_8_21_14_0_10_41_13 TaxID=1974476 RepID=A0A2M6WC50_9BACT|nr:MAG: DNA recombination protein RmuC [Candidatus Komeilibacteria bacterium CG10_big_fil_rev_8_21_14_0_10_41_13]
MEILLIIILIVIVLGFVALFWAQAKKNKDQGQDQSMLMLQNQINEISKTLDSKLGDSNKMLQGQLAESAKIVRDVTEKLTKLDETNRQVVSFADQLKSLQDILKNPKQRGVLGEYYLETVLKNVLPPKAYQMQYKFKNGEIVDAVIFLKDKIVPIDSKFSLENYNKILNENDEAEKEKLEKIFKQDLKNRIDETAKYIRPAENTMDFAFMFIPAEAIYYDLLVNKVGAVQVNTRDLIEYAFKEKKVIIVSPTSFFAYLQTVLQGLRALQIEESAKEIRDRVDKLGRHILNFDVYMQKLGNNLSTTVNAYNTSYKEFKKIDKDVVRIAGGESQIEALEIDRPKGE